MSNNNHLITCPKCRTVCEPGDSECEDCGYPFNRPKILLACPLCEAPREKNRRGVYKWFCSCGYEYEDSVYRKGKGSASHKETGATGELPKDGVKLQEETDSDYDTIASVPPGSLMSCPLSGTISVEGSKGGDGVSSRTNQAAGEGHGKGKTGTVLRTDSFTKDGRPPSDSLSLSELSCDPQSSTSVPLDTSLAGPQSSAPMQQSFPSLGLATSASPVPVPVNKIPPPTSKVTPSSPSSINPSLTHVSPSQSPIRGSLPSAPLSNGPFTSSPMPHPQPSRRIQSIASSIRPRSVPLPLRAQSPEHFKRSKSENSIQNVCLSDSPLKLQPLDSTNRAQEKIRPPLVSPQEDIITAGPHVPTLGHNQATKAAGSNKDELAAAPNAAALTAASGGADSSAALTEANGGADAAAEFDAVTGVGAAAGVGVDTAAGIAIATMLAPAFLLSLLFQTSSTNKYADLNNRINSLKQSKCGREVHRESLALAGFYFDKYVKALRCYRCEVVIPMSDENLQYNPWILHTRESRDCPLLKTVNPSNKELENKAQNIDVTSSVGQMSNILQQKMFDEVYGIQTKDEVSSSESSSTSSLNPNDEQVDEERDHQSSPEVSETLSAVSSSTLNADEQSHGAGVGIGQNDDHNYDNMSLELGEFTAAEVNSSALQPNAQSSPNAANAQSIKNAVNNHDSSDAAENSDCCGSQPKSLKQSRSVEERMHELEQTVIDLARENARLKRAIRKRDESVSGLRSLVNSYHDESEHNSNSINHLQKESLETKVQVNKNKEEICEMKKCGNEARDQRRALSLKANQTTDDVKDLQVARREMEVDMSEHKEKCHCCVNRYNQVVEQVHSSDEEAVQ